MSANNRQNYIAKLADQDTYQIGSKTFEYHKVTNRQFNELEEMKLKLRAEKDAEKGTKLMDETMRKSALYLLGITDVEYDDLPREDMGYAIEAASFRTLYGKPFLGANSTTTSVSAAKSEALATKPTS